MRHRPGRHIAILAMISLNVITCAGGNSKIPLTSCAAFCPDGSSHSRDDDWVLIDLKAYR